MTTPNGMEIIESGWTVSGIQDAIKRGCKVLALIDPVENNDPLINHNKAATEANQLQGICALRAEERLLGYLQHEENENDDDNSNWEWSTNVEHSMTLRTSLMNSLLFILVELLLIFVI